MVVFVATHSDVRRLVVEKSEAVAVGGKGVSNERKWDSTLIEAIYIGIQERGCLSEKFHRCRVACHRQIAISLHSVIALTLQTHDNGATLDLLQSNT